MPFVNEHSECACEVVEPQQLATRADHNADRVEANLVGTWPRRSFVGQVGRGHPPHLELFAWAQRVERGAGRPSRLDLAERQRAAVERDEVDLSEPCPVLAGDDLETEALEMLGRERLTAVPECSP